MKNKNKYTSVRLKQFSQGFLFSFLSLFLNRKKRIIFNSSYNDRFNFNSKYLFLYYLENRKDIKVYFVVNDNKLRRTLSLKYGDFFIRNKTLKEKIFILQSSIWVTSTMETPILGFFYKFRRYVLHLSHGVVFKNAGVSENNTSILKKTYYFIIRSNFTQYLATSQNLAKATAKVYGTSSKHILIAGMPRNDVILNDSREKRSFLYAPTWRPFSKQYPLPCHPSQEHLLLEFLEDNNISLYIRHHPYFELDNYNYSSSSIINFDSSVCSDLSLSLNKFQGIITDYSSLFIDALLLETNLAFYDYDYELFNEKVGFLFDYHKSIPGPQVTNIEELKKFFISSLNYEGTQKRQDLKKFFFDDTSGRYSEKLSNLLDSK